MMVQCKTWPSDLEYLPNYLFSGSYVSMKRVMGHSLEVHAKFQVKSDFFIHAAFWKATSMLLSYQSQEN